MNMFRSCLILLQTLVFITACGDASQELSSPSAQSASKVLSADFNGGCAKAVLSGNTVQIQFNNFEADGAGNQKLVNCNARNILVPIAAGKQFRIKKVSSKAFTDPEKGQDNRRIEIESRGIGQGGNFTNLFEDVPSQVSGAVNQDHKGRDTNFTACGASVGKISLTTRLTSVHGTGADRDAPLRVRLNSVTYELESRSCS